MQWIKRFIDEEDGQDVSEFGVLIATLTVAAMVVLTAFGAAASAWASGVLSRIAGQ